MRIGLATGTVVINQFKGGEGKIETLAIGQSVNFAARLQSLARSGNLVIDTPTKTLVDGLFNVEDIGPVNVDGFNDPAPLFKALCAHRVRSRFEAQNRGSTTTFWGRKPELVQALAGWTECLGSKGRMVVVRGEPGIGKSRFVQEVMAKLGRDAKEQVRLQCSAHSSSPLFPVIDALSIMANTMPADTAAQTLDRLRSLLMTTGEAQTLLLGLFEQGHAAPLQTLNCTEIRR